MARRRNNRPNLAELQVEVRGGFKTISRGNRQLDFMIGPAGEETLANELVGRRMTHDPALDPEVEIRNRLPAEGESFRIGHPFNSIEQQRNRQMNAYSDTVRGNFDIVMGDVKGLGSRNSKAIFRPARPRDTPSKTVSRGRAQ